MNKGLFTLLLAASGFILLLTFSSITEASTLSSQAQCKDIEAIFARGSGTKGPTDSASDKFSDSVTSLLINKSVSYNQYNLGAEKYDNAQYPHTEISFNVGLGAFFSGGEHFKYGKSVDEGVRELKGYLTARMKHCPNAAFVLAGYSQGAQVVGDTLGQLPKETRDKISYIALFADPKLNLPEAREYTVYDNFIDSGGNPFSESGDLIDPIPDACYGTHLSVWRHTVDNCKETYHGILGPRKPYVPYDLAGRSNLWCIAHDSMCGSSSATSGDNSGHESHYVEDRSIPTAAKEALTAVANQMPALKPQLVVDAQILKQELVQNTQYDVAVLNSEYCYAGDLPGDVDIYKKIYAGAKLPGNLFIGYGHFFGDGYDYTPDNAVSLITPQYPVEAWRNNVQKLIYVFSEPWCRVRFDNPDKLVNYGEINKNQSMRQTRMSAFSKGSEVSPTIVLLTTPAQKDSATNIALRYDNYYVAPYSYEVKNINDIPGPSDILLQNVYSPEFATDEYTPLVSQPINFSLKTGSLSPMLTRYDWDFDDDGMTDQSTTEASATHTYNEPYSGQIRVKAADADGANGITVAHVTTTTVAAAHTPISTPTEVHITKISSSSAVVEWSSSVTGVDSWLVRIGGFPVGRVSKESHTATINDLDFSMPLTISVSGLSADGTEGEPASSTIESDQTHESKALSKIGSDDVYTLITQQDNYRENNVGKQTSQPNSSPTIAESSRSKSDTNSSANRHSSITFPLVVATLCCITSIAVIGLTIRAIIRHKRQL